MPHTDIIEIFGTVEPAYLPDTGESWPTIALVVKAHSGEQARIVANCGCQVSGSPMPFSLRLDRSLLNDSDTLTLEASCGVAFGEPWKLLQQSMPLMLDEQKQIGPLSLRLEPIAGKVHPNSGKMPISPLVIPVGLSVVIPEALVKANTHLDVAVLRVQENGQSNRASSNIGETSLYHAGSGTAFTLYLDANVLAPTDHLKLHVAQYDVDRTVAMAGYVIRNLNPDDLKDFGEITLRAPRKKTS